MEIEEDSYIEYDSSISEDDFNKLNSYLKNKGYKNIGYEQGYSSFKGIWSTLAIYPESKTFSLVGTSYRYGNKLNISDILGEEAIKRYLAVHVDTQEKWDIVQTITKNIYNRWDTHKTNSCISISDGYYCDMGWYEKKRYTILSFEQWQDRFAPETKLVKEKAPKFKEGDWVFTLSSRQVKGTRGSGYIEGEIFKIASIDEYPEDGEEADVIWKVGGGNGVYSRALRLATEKEIESVTAISQEAAPIKETYNMLNILKECTRKFPIGTVVKSAFSGGGDYTVSIPFIVENYMNQHHVVHGKGGFSVWCNGRYSEIISLPREPAIEKDPKQRHSYKNGDIVRVLKPTGILESGDVGIVDNLISQVSFRVHVAGKANVGNWAGSDIVEPFNLIPVEEQKSSSLILVDEILTVKTNKKETRRRTPSITLIN